MVDEADLDADLLTLQVGYRVDAGPRDDHVVAIAVVVDQDSDARRIARTGHQRIPIGHAHRVHLAFGKGFDGWHVLEPNEGDSYAGILEIALFQRNFPGDPARPIAIRNAQWSVRRLARSGGGSRRSSGIGAWAWGGRTRALGLVTTEQRQEQHSRTDRDH